MDVRLSAEQRALRDSVAQLVDRHGPKSVAELDDVERRYPADHYVLIDDKPRILAAVKATWGDRVTTVLPRQGQFAHAPDASSYPVDLTVERISDLLTVDLSVLCPSRHR